MPANGWAEATDPDTELSAVVAAKAKASGKAAMSAPVSKAGRPPLSAECPSSAVFRMLIVRNIK